jgi:hypothetical protein
LSAISLVLVAKELLLVANESMTAEGFIPEREIRGQKR